MSDSALADADSEHALLSAVMLDNRLYERIVELLRPQDFAFPLHGRIFALIGRLIDKGQEASPISLWPLLAEDTALKEAGGKAYLGRIAAAAPTLRGVQDWARQLAELARRRAIIAACR